MPSTFRAYQAPMGRIHITCSDRLFAPPARKNTTTPSAAVTPAKDMPTCLAVRPRREKVARAPMMGTRASVVSQGKLISTISLSQASRPSMSTTPITTTPMSIVRP